ncbi:MAG: MFS transporter, partial [Lachnospiraceae bacterium]
IAVVLVAVCKIPKYESAQKDTILQMKKEAIDGFKILCQNKGMLGLVLVSSLYTMALMPVSALFPLMSMDHFGGTSTHASIVEIVFAIGFLVGSVVLGKWGGTKNKIYTIVGSYILMAVCLLGSGLLPSNGYVFFVVSAGFMGVSGPFYWGMFTPLLQQNFTEQYMGRVLSITGSMRLISGPLALLVSGAIADQWGEEKWFLIAGVLVLIATTIILAVPQIRRCDESGNNP